MESSENENMSRATALRPLLIAFGSAIAIVSALLIYMAVSANVVADKYVLSDGERPVVLEVRLAIAQSAVDGSGELTDSMCSTLESISKELDSKAKWFSSCEFSMSGSSPDTSTESIIKLSDGDYCATFTFDKEVRTLKDYSFTEQACGDSRLN